MFAGSYAVFAMAALCLGLIQNAPKTLELRKTIAELETQIEKWRKLEAAGKAPCGAFYSRDFRGELAMARVRLAGITNDWKTVLAEAPLAIRHYERGIKLVERLLSAKALEVNEAGAAVSEYRGNLNQVKHLLELAERKDLPADSKK